MAVDVAQLLSFTVKNNASDLHLSGGVPPMIRVDGDIKRINMPALTHKDVNSMVYDIMNDKQRKDYEEFLETDFSFEIPKLARFRVNAYNQNRGSAAVFRIIPSEILTLDDLGAPAIFKDVSMHPRGIILVTGPTGSGKSTTLAAMVDYINENKPDHILTIEDPIEFVHESKKSLVNQREVHRDTLGFNEALWHTAHEFSRQNDRPGRRRIPGGGERDGARDVVGIAARGDFPDPAEKDRWRANRRTRNHDRHPGDQEPDSRRQDRADVFGYPDWPGVRYADAGPESRRIADEGPHQQGRGALSRCQQREFLGFQARTGDSKHGTRASSKADTEPASQDGRA
jgi:energy-coupling factor transporter ATP-binding protein EcfA2